MVHDLAAFPHDHPRRFVPQDAEFTWGAIEPLFDDLRARRAAGVEDLKLLLRDEDELNSYLNEQRAIRYINSTRQTDNPEFTRAFEVYIRELEPKIKVASFELLKAYSASPFRRALPPELYGLEDRRRDAALRTFRPENVDLEKEDSELALKYQRIRGSMTVDYRGQEMTLQQMAKILEDNDRGVREETWRLSEVRSLKDRVSLDEIYSRMVGIREKVASNAGFANYEDYIFVKKARFDYTPEDCAEFHSAVEEYIVPLSREIDKRRLEKLGVDALRPWDMAVDPEGREPLGPFEDVGHLVGGVAKVLDQVDKQLSSYFSRMVELGLLDLDSRKGKAPGGYQSDLSEARLPFIFMNAAKKDGDVRTLLHESGHSFHTFLMRDMHLPFFNANENLPTEFAEVASTTMEIISGGHLEGTFYDKDQARRSNLQEAVGNVKLFTWVATIDSFQQWVYSHRSHSPGERLSAWVEIFNRFKGLESYEGLEESMSYRWQKQLHLFEVPFYYIEYAIALTGALGIWSRYRTDQKGAIKAYKSALSLGASRPLPDLFKAAGVEWGFGRSAMRKIADDLGSAIREFGA